MSADALQQEVQNIAKHARRLKHDLEIVGQIKSGKEATVYAIIFNGMPAAMKLYKAQDQRTFQGIDEYITGKFYRSASHRLAVAKKNAFGKRLQHENWIRREYFMLEKLHQLGAKIPKPYCRIEHAIIMELLAEDGQYAPRLCDIELSDKELQTALASILQTMKIFWDFGIVHGDLSEFNVLWWADDAYVIDFPQAIDRRTHPNAAALLQRDIDNVHAFFSKRIAVDKEEIEALFSHESDEI